MERRDFLKQVAVQAGLLVLGGGIARAQQADSATQGDTARMPGMDTSNLFAMNQLASRPVRLPPKPGARPSMTAAQRDELEHHIKCQCGCTLDVYTCRTTDFSCQVSPAMHRDVMALVAGGYSAPEIIKAFTDVYGEQVLMQPTKEGFNLVGYVAPFVALGGGAAVVFALIRRWGSRAAPAAARPLGTAPGVDASADELARLDAAVRDDR